MKKCFIIYLMFIILFHVGCSTDIHDENEVSYQYELRKLKGIASECGFPSMPVELNESIIPPLSPEYYANFEAKLKLLHQITEEAINVKSLQTSRALSDGYYRGVVTIEQCQFPISIYWDEEFTPERCFAIADGICSHIYPSVHLSYNYIQYVTLSHVSTKQSASYIPILYFVIRCNITGYYNSTTISFRKHVEFIAQLNVNTMILTTTITTLKDGSWGPKDFEL